MSIHVEIHAFQRAHSIEIHRQCKSKLQHFNKPFRFYVHFKTKFDSLCLLVYSIQNGNYAGFEEDRKANWKSNAEHDIE